MKTKLSLEQVGCNKQRILVEFSKRCVCIFILFHNLSLGFMTKVEEQAKARRRFKQIKGMKIKTFLKLLELTTTLGIGSSKLP
jgi:hypothetical protein